ncbi:MAG: response regulator, partial [Candidatus Bipolaricaulota bacterium]
MAIQVFEEPPRWQVVWVEDGVAALEVLRHKGKHASTPVPELLLLSIQMPRMRGPEVLWRVKESPELANLPVVMWSV